MKKFLTTILALVYLATSMGATVHLHYCMGKLFSWSLTDKDSKNCGQCGMPKSNMGGHCMTTKDGCCKDKHAHIQLDKDQKTTENSYTFLGLSLIAIPATMAAFSDLYVVSSILGYPTTNAPPEPDKVLRIYPQLYFPYLIFFSSIDVRHSARTRAQTSSPL